MSGQVARPGRTPGVVLHGFYGAGNLGDDAVLTATLGQLAGIGLRPCVFGVGPESVRASHGVEALDPRRRLGAPALHRLVRADAYLLGGGGLLKDYDDSPRTLESWVRWLARAQRLGRRTMLWSIGVENLRFERSRDRVRRVVDAADVVTVRDEASRDRLREVGVTRELDVTADPAVLLAEPFRRAREDRVPRRIVVCVRHWYDRGLYIADPAANDRMEASLAGALRTAVDRWDATVEFVPFRVTPYDDDRVAAERVAKRIDRSGRVVHRPRPQHPEEAARVLAGADLVVGMRLHSAILATAAGVPTVALAYMPKVEDYMRHAGADRWCSRLDELSEEWLVDAFLEVERRYAAISAELAGAAERMCRSVERNARLLGGLLDGATRAAAEAR